MKFWSLNITSIIIACILFSGCKDEYTGSVHLQPSLNGKYLNVSQTNFSYLTPEAFSDNFKVNSYETNWKFSAVADWISLSPASGSLSQNVVLNGLENTSGDSRTSIFYLESDDNEVNYTKTMSVSQGGVQASLTVEPTELSFKGGGESKDVLVIANCEWRAKSAQDWIALNVTNSSDLKITASPNPSQNYRVGTVYITYGDNKNIVINITQFPSSISSSETVLNFGNEAAKYEIEITAEMEWTAVVSDNWINVDQESGSAGKTKLNIEVAPNMSVSSRSGFVSFNTGGNERFQIKIEQDGLFIKSVEEVIFRSVESSQKIEIKSNTEWTVSSSSDWLKISPSSGAGNGEIVVTASDNPDSSTRNGTILIHHKGLSLEWSINISQLGGTLEPGEKIIEFSDKKDSRSFELVSDGSWSSSCSDSWFTASPSSGNGDMTVTVSVEENVEENTRGGEIIYTFGNQTAKVEIQQAGKYFNVDNEAFEFDSHGGTHSITLSTNEKWTAEIVDHLSWLKLSSLSGDGEETITVSVEDNPSVNSRQAEILIHPENLPVIKIVVNQKARFLTLSSASVTFYSEGGTSNPISVRTDGEFQVSSDSPWCMVNQNEDNTFTVTVEDYKVPGTRTAKITASLTDLKEGSLALVISVIQIGEGCSFIVDGFFQEKDWSSFGNSSLSFAIIGYTSDQNWDTTQQSKITMLRTGFNGEDDWNPNPNNVDFVKDGYGDTKDENWDSQQQGEEDFTKEGFSSEENWNGQKEEELEINKEGYTPEKNWN